MKTYFKKKISTLVIGSVVGFVFVNNGDAQDSVKNGNSFRTDEVRETKNDNHPSAEKVLNYDLEIHVDVDSVNELINSIKVVKIDSDKKPIETLFEYKYGKEGSSLNIKEDSVIPACITGVFDIVITDWNNRLKEKKQNRKVNVLSQYIIREKPALNQIKNCIKQNINYKVDGNLLESFAWGALDGFLVAIGAGVIGKGTFSGDLANPIINEVAKKIYSKKNPCKN